jgi:hypothetical protein
VRRYVRVGEVVGAHRQSFGFAPDRVQGRAGKITQDPSVRRAPCVRASSHPSRTSPGTSANGALVPTSQLRRGGCDQALGRGHVATSTETKSRQLTHRLRGASEALSGRMPQPSSARRRRMSGSTFRVCGSCPARTRWRAGERRCRTCGSRSFTWFYVIDLGPDPTTGKRRQQKRGGFATQSEAEHALESARRESVRRGRAAPPRLLLAASSTNGSTRDG